MKRLRIESARITKHDDSARIEFAVARQSDDAVEEFVLWFETDIEHAQYICDDRADCVVVAVLAHALRFGFEEIVSKLPISEKLYYGLTYQIIPQLSVADNGYGPLRIVAPLTAERYGGTQVGAGMSRGVDSLTTLYEYGRDFELPSYRLTNFTFFNVGAFHGLDKIAGKSRFSRQELYEKELEGTRELSDALGYDLLAVDSNLSAFLRDALGRTYFDRTHTFRNLCIPLLFQKMYRRYYYSAAYSLDEFKLSLKVDSAEYEKAILPYLGTENVEFHSSNQAWTRFQKMQRMIHLEASYDYLQVCFVSPHNCGECSKCRKTIMALDVLGVLDKYAKSFDLDKYMAKNREEWFSRIYELKRGEGLYEDDFKEIYEYAVAHHFPLIGEPELQSIYVDNTIGRVVRKGVIRSLPSKSSDILLKLAKSAPVVCIGEVDGWVRVKAGNMSGYIEKASLRIIDPVVCSSKGVVKQATGLMDMPTKHSDLSCSLEPGERVHITVKSGRWRLVTTRGQQVGWVRAENVVCGSRIRRLSRAFRRKRQ